MAPFVKKPGFETRPKLSHNLRRKFTSKLSFWNKKVLKICCNANLLKRLWSFCIAQEKKSSKQVTHLHPSVGGGGCAQALIGDVLLAEVELLHRFRELRLPFSAF